MVRNPVRGAVASLALLLALAAGCGPKETQQTSQAPMEVFVTEGGVFDSATPAPVSVKDGEMIVEFSGCKDGTVTYNITSINQQGQVPIQRISLDNVGLCETLSTATQ